MASITSETNGRKTIQFVAADKRRRSIWLGRVSLRVAEAVKVRVEHLVAASITAHAVDGETARWVADLDDALRDKLAAVGLVVNGGDVAMTSLTLVGGFVNSDAVVDGADVSALLGAFGTDGITDRVDGSGNVIDLNGNTFVDALDVDLTTRNIGAVEVVTWLWSVAP